LNYLESIMTRDWQNEPMTQAETDAWDEHEAYLVGLGQHDRAAFMEHKAHEMNVAICNAIANQAPWGD